MSHRVAWLLVVCWCACVALGIRFMLGYESTAANIRPAVAHWPAESQLEHDRQRPTLVMFIHPRCPCSRASLEELGNVASECAGLARMHAVFIGPDAAAAGQQWLSNASAARAIPGVRLHYDEDSREANTFHATTSGETLLYAADGWLLFHGGLTWARGHQGDNYGGAAITDLIQGRATLLQSTAVFGCELTNVRGITPGAVTDGTVANNRQ